jgi:shikimate kinase
MTLGMPTRGLSSATGIGTVSAFKGKRLPSQADIVRSGRKRNPNAMTDKVNDKPCEADALRARLGRRAIVLIGMPGSGKSSIGRRLAQRLGLPFADADTEIEQAAGMSIIDIFASRGEAEFRAGEARVIARMIDERPRVIATGGGAFMNTDTRALVGARAVSIWLKAEIPVLLRRVKRKSDRPLLQTADPEGTLQKLLNEREATYAKADIVIPSHEGPHEAVVEAIVAALDRRLAAAEATP